MKTRAQKEADVELLAGDFRESPHVIVMGFQGLPVSKDWELRNKLRKAQLKYRVVKNTLAEIAAKGTPAEQLAVHFKSMTSVALSKEDPVVLAKILNDFSKENAQVVFRGVMIEGRVISPKEVESIANLPGKPELISKIMFLLKAPAQRLAMVTNGVARALTVVTGQVRDQKQGATPVE